MIGFKTIDDFTFDDCFLHIKKCNENGHEPDPEIIELFSRLKNTLERDDDRLFINCLTDDDFEKYLSHFSAPGTQLYSPKHVVEAVLAIEDIRKKLRSRKIVKIVVGLLLGIIVGLPAQRYLPYLAAYLTQRDSVDWYYVFPIAYSVLFILFIIARIARKKATYNCYIAFFGGILIACIPMSRYSYFNRVSYGSFSHYGTYYGANWDGRHAGIADCFGNIVIPKEYSCFYEIDPDIIIGVTANTSGTLSIDWYDWYDRYEKDGSCYIGSDDFWIVDNNTSLSLKEAIEGGANTIVHSWCFNALNIVTRDGKKLHWKDSFSNHWRDPEILELRVIKK